MNHAATVMVVDDDDDMRDVMTDALADEGYVVLGASNGRDALAKLAGGSKPNVILLDLMMPVLDGLGFREAQRTQPALAQIPVIAFTAHGASDDISARLGAAAFLRKPVHLDVLLETIGRVLAGAGAAKPSLE